MPVNNTQWNRIRYSIWVPVYDAIAGRLGTPRRKAIEQLNLEPGARVLLVGAGTGLDLDFLPANVEITATDLTPAMLRKLEKKAKRLGLKVIVRVMDGEKLEFADGEFDHVLLHLILAVIPDPLACIREAARVLKPSGTISIFDKFAPDGKSLSLIRRGLNLVTNPLATDITRKLDPILEAGHLTIVRETPGVLGGMVRVVVAEKN